jgi:glutathione S-transferase
MMRRRPLAVHLRWGWTRAIVVCDDAAFRLEEIMGKPIIHGIARSRAFRCHWAALETGVSFDRAEVGFDGATNKTPDFLAVNPMGQVPALSDGNLHLAESMAINIYLAKAYGGTLHPDTLVGEAQVLQWSFLAATQLDPRFTLWFYHTQMYAPEKRVAAIAEEQIALLQAPLDMINRHLETRTWLLGETFTIADVNVASTMVRLRTMPEQTAGRPHLGEWFKRCYDRPAAKTALSWRE